MTSIIKYLYNKFKRLLHFITIPNRILKLNVGAGGVPFDKSWYSCDINVLDLTKREDWISLLKNKKVNNIFAEHVWEHLNEKDTRLANINCFEFLKKGGRLRLAVPDGFHPDKEYIEYVKPNGTGIGSDDHKILYDYNIMKQNLEKVGFKVILVEYWDESGKFHYIKWSKKHGKVSRSKDYDIRNKNGKLNYTSLIVDAIKE